MPVRQAMHLCWKAASIILECFVVELTVVCTVSSFAHTLEV